MSINRLTLIIVFLSFKMFPQRFNFLGDDKKFIDSITVLIETTKDDSIKSLNSFKLADLYRRNKDNLQFEKFLRIGNKYKKKYPYLVDCSSYYNALKFLLKNDIDSYSKTILVTLEKLKKHKFKESYELQSIIYQNLSIIKRIQDNERESMDYLVNKAIVTAKKSNNREIIGDIYKHIGIALMNNGDRIKAKEYYLLSIANFEKAATNSPLLTESKVEIYLIAAENNAYLEDYVSSQKYLDKAYLILKKYPKSNLNGMYYFSNGINLYKQSKFQQSIESYDKGIANCIENNDILSLNRLKFVKYQSLFELGKLNEANDILIDLIENGNLMIGDKKNYYKEVANSYQKLGNYKAAVEYANKYIKLNDSLIENGIKKEILTLETKFNTSEKERKILQLEKEKIEKEIRLKNLKMWYGFLTLTLIITIVLFYFLFKSYKIQKRLNKQQTIIHNQNIEYLKSQKEIETMQAMIDGEESERKRISRDLHDGIGSRLSSLKMQLEQLDLKSCTVEDYEKFSSNLNLVIKDLRQTAFNLVPETLSKLGLELALKDLCFAMSNSNIKILYNSNEITSNILSSHQVTIFRIVQELINNALKHSNCTEIIVDCSQNSALFLITVEDNGIGFDVEDIGSLKGLGLKNIKNRIELLNGKFDVKSSEGKGTVFNIELMVKLVEENKQDTVDTDYYPISNK